jgi:hypothetical protein
MAEQAEWNRGLEPIGPLVEYFEREMGQLSGRLMAALSLLVDLEDSHRWTDQVAMARDSVRYSRLLVASVLRIVAAAQAEQDETLTTAGAIDAALQRLAGASGDGPPEPTLGILDPHDRLTEER